MGTHGREEKYIQGLVGGRNRDRILLTRPRRRWKDKIKTVLKGTTWEGVDWIKLAQNRDQLNSSINILMNLNVPQNARDLLTS